MMIHISEMNPDTQQGNDCEFNCIGCPLLEYVEFDALDKQIFVKCKKNQV